MRNTTREKKFYVATLRTHNNNINKRWYVAWYVPVPGTDLRRRIKKYGKINYAKTVTERLSRTEAFMKTVDVYDIPPTLREKAKEIAENNLLHTAIEHRWLRPSSKKFYKSHVKHFCKWLNKLPEKCTGADAHNYLKNLLENGQSHTTVNHKKTTLKSLYAWLVEEKHIKINPFEKIKKLAENKQSKMFFTSAEIASIKEYLTATTPDVWMACQFLFYCFIRPNELRQLKVKDIDFNRMKITVPGEVAKNKKTQMVEIPFPFQQQIINHYKGKDTNNYLMGNGEEKLPSNHIAKVFRDCLNALGFDTRYRLYSFKHTGVVMFYQATKDIKATQMQLRHSSLGVVNEYLKNLGCFDNDSVRNNFPAI